MRSAYGSALVMDAARGTGSPDTSGHADVSTAGDSAADLSYVTLRATKKRIEKKMSLLEAKFETSPIAKQFQVRIASLKFVIEKLEYLTGNVGLLEHDFAYAFN